MDFKNGLASFAGQRERYSNYSEASKRIHSSGTMIAASPENYYVFVMKQLYETVYNLAPWIIQYLETNGYVKEGKELEDFRYSVNRDLEQMTKNHKIIIEKFSIE